MITLLLQSWTSLKCELKEISFCFRDTFLLAFSVLKKEQESALVLLLYFFVTLSFIVYVTPDDHGPRNLVVFNGITNVLFLLFRFYYSTNYKTDSVELYWPASISRWQNRLSPFVIEGDKCCKHFRYRQKKKTKHFFFPLRYKSISIGTDSFTTSYVKNRWGYR